MINKLTIAIPIRRRVYSLVNCIRMLLAHSKFQHDIVLVFDRPSLFVEKWVEQNKDRLESHGIKILKSAFAEYPDPKIFDYDQFGTANASNLAWKYAKTEWLMCMDDDMYCSENWDYNLLKRVEDPAMIYVPINVVSQTSVNERVANWGEWYHLTFPSSLVIPLKQPDALRYFEDIREPNPDYVLESKWIEWCFNIQVNNVYIERCSERKLCHWMPLVIHKSVFEKSGGFYPGTGRDINFDSKLGKMGYMKMGIRNSFFLHMKGFMVLDLTQPRIKISDMLGEDKKWMSMKDLA